MTNGKPLSDTNSDDPLHHDTAFRERLAAYGRRVVERAGSGDDELYNLMDWVEHEYYKIVHDVLDSTSEESGFDECMQVTVREIADCKEQTEHTPRKLFSGISGLDEITGGFESDDLVVLAGRPGVGKTSLLLTMLDHMATVEKKSVAIFCPGTSNMLICQRLLAVHTQIGLRSIQHGDLSPEQRLELEDAAGAFCESRTAVKCSYPKTFSMFRGQVQDVKIKQGTELDCVFIDGYADLMDGFSASGASAGSANIWRRLKELTYMFRVPVIVSVCMPEQPDSNIQLADLREYAPQACIADKILLLNCRQPDCDQESGGRKQQEHTLTVGKNSGGRTGVTHLILDRELDA
jgi:replicative DNA helicase